MEGRGAGDEGARRRWHPGAFESRGERVAIEVANRERGIYGNRARLLGLGETLQRVSALAHRQDQVGTCEGMVATRGRRVAKAGRVDRLDLNPFALQFQQGRVEDGRV